MYRIYMTRIEEIAPKNNTGSIYIVLFFIFWDPPKCHSDCVCGASLGFLLKGDSVRLEPAPFQILAPNFRNVMLAY